MKNQEIAKILYEIAEMLDIINENRFKSAAYRRVAKTIELMPIESSEVYRKGGLSALRGIPGVGEHISAKIEELIKTGKSGYYADLKKRIPAEIGGLMNVPGLGPRKIRKITEKLGVRTIAQLKKAALQHKIAKLSGFGLESEKDILEGIELMKKMPGGRIPFAKAEKIANKVVDYLKKVNNIDKIAIAGSLRRKRAMVRDIDILVSSRKPEKIIDNFVNMKEVSKVLGKGPTKATIILNSGIQTDVRVLSPESWGAGLFYFTGSKAYNIETRKIAIKKGFKLNEYGLFDKKTGKMIAGKTEEEICKKLGIKWISPEEREI